MTEEEKQPELTEEQAEELLRGLQEQKETNITFFSRVIKTKDSTKVGNLSEEELGISRLPVRTYKELALQCNELFEEKEFGDFFDKQAEIQLATSLSKGGFLIKQVGTSRKEVADMTPQKKANPSYFKKKDKEEPR
jgi:hypothetical protein